MQPIVIIGAGGFAREALDVVDAVNAVAPQFEPLGYIVDPQYGLPGIMVNGLPILGGFDWLLAHAKDASVTCAVGPSHHRYQLVQRALSAGCRFFNLVHPTAQLTRWIEMGVGVIITAGCVLTNQIRIGDHVHINLGCTIGHDSSLEDFVTVAPGVHVSGNVKLGEGCYLGTGANVIEKVRIGAWSVVGAGSTVLRDLPANTTAVGVPARTIKEREPGWHLQ